MMTLFTFAKSLSRSFESGHLFNAKLRAARDVLREVLP
jgi:hypothetical protein